MLPTLYALPFYDFDLRASHARKLLPAALASVSFGLVLVRVRATPVAVRYLFYFNLGFHPYVFSTCQLRDCAVSSLTGTGGELSHMPSRKQVTEEGS